MEGCWWCVVCAFEGLELHADGRGEELRRGGVLRRCEGSIRGDWLPIRVQGSRHRLAHQGPTALLAVAFVDGQVL